MSLTLTYNTMDRKCQSNTTILNIKHIYNVTAGLHVSTLTESSSGLRDTDPYKECIMHFGIPSAHNICSE